MMTDKRNAFGLRGLLKSKPSKVLAMIDSWVNEGRIDRSVNWLGLAEAAGTKAATAERRGMREDALQWADVKIRVNELILCSTEPHNAENFQINAMMTRLSMIRKYGEEPQHPILDPKIIEAWALDFPKVSIEQASKYKDYRTLPPELRIRLGRAYGRLKVLALLYEIVAREPLPEVRQALDLWEKLK